MNSLSPVIDLRPASGADVEAIAAIWFPGWRDAHVDHVPEGLVRLRRPEHLRGHIPAMLDQTTVVSLDDQVVGFVVVRDDEVEQLYVDAAARGTGIAAALLEHAETGIAARFDQAWLAVAAGNRRARRFYEREGWSDGGAFAYEAWSPDAGSIRVPARRYVKRVGGGA